MPVGTRVDRDDPPWARKVESESAEEDGPRSSWEDGDKSGLGGKKASNVKPHLIGAIDEVIDEVTSAVDNVAKGAGSHIHST